MAVKSFFRAAALIVSSLLPVCLAVPLVAQQTAAATEPNQATTADSSITTFRTTVRRVVVDVVVTDADGNPVRGLNKDDFIIAEDGEPQKALSFEANGFTDGMDYMPPKLPPEPVNTFVNLPSTPEKGPLYVLLYDLVNMDNEDQMSLDANQHEDQVRSRQQLMKFIENKPEGARFAIFVWSDGLHLIQGFTSDKATLLAAVDPHNAKPHIPTVYLMGENVGRANPRATVVILNQLSAYLNGMPGRKNLIWFSGTFPLSLAATKDDGPNYTEQIKSTLNLLAQNQIAIYPVDVRGVVVQNWHANNSMIEDGPEVSQKNVGNPAVGGGATNSTTNSGVGAPLITGSYSDMDVIAVATGGRAFYSNNDASSELVQATQNGTSYYTLTYAPTNHQYDGGMRKIRVRLTPESAKKGYRLEYRHGYYGTEDATPNAPGLSDAAANTTSGEPQRRADDALDVNMKHGAPTVHQLLFAAHVHAVGPPSKGTPEQMAQLGRQQAYAKGRKNEKLSSILLQKVAIDYTVMTHQLQLQDGRPMNLEIAAAAYDTDGAVLNNVVNKATGDTGGPSAQPAKVYRIQQEIEVPLAATSIRVAIHDANTGRVGAMEIKLPLAPENQSASTTDSGKAGQQPN